MLSASAPKLATGGQDTIRRVRDFAGALQLPPSALYFECNQERVRALEAHLAELETLLDTLRAEGVAAATRLVTLDGMPTATFQSYVDVAGGAL